MRNLVSNRLALFALAVIASVGLIQAATLIYTSNDVRYIAHWTWNDEDAGTLTVELLLKAAPPRRPPDRAALNCIRNMKARVVAIARDGTTVENSKVLQIPLGATREVQIPFDRLLTSLQFIQVISLPGGTCDI